MILLAAFDFGAETDIVVIDDDHEQEPNHHHETDFG